jgi:hypothetical protein
MSTERRFRKPHPDAIPTIYGWALPKTGEVLVCVRGLPNPVEGFVPNRPYKGEIPKETTETEPEQAPVEAETKADDHETEKKPRRRTKSSKTAQ